MQALMAGFNGFGQFDCELEQNLAAFKVLKTTHLSQPVEHPLIACSWSYAAFAQNCQLVLQGFLSGQKQAKCSWTCSESITQLCCCERYCLLLLANGKLCKLKPSLTAQLQEISISELNTHTKRTYTGAKKQANAIKITHIALGAYIAVAISSNNVVYNLPTQVHQFPAHFRVKQLQCGFEHALLLSEQGNVYSWGNGLRGQLAHEQLEMQETPALIDYLAGIKITHIAAAGWHCAAISAFGDLFTWGFNSNGQLGIQILKNSDGFKQPTVFHLPQALDLPKCCRDQDDCLPIKVFAGSRHTIVLMNCGQLMATGWNVHGQCALADDLKSCDCFQKIQNIKKTTNLNIVCAAWNTILMDNFF